MAEEKKINSVKIPEVEVSPVADASCPPPPIDDQFKGLCKRVSDGMEFAYAIHEADTYGRTHTAKNSSLFWQGVESEFRQLFDKK